MKKTRIVYITPSLYIPGGVERVLTTKANYLAEEMEYEVFIVLTDGKGKSPYYPVSPQIHLIQLNIGFEELWSAGFFKKAALYLRKQRLFRKELARVLNDIKPDITVSLLRREINFLTSMKDGSKKVGELHVNRSHYRNFEKGGSNPILNIAATLWQSQLLKKLKKLDAFIVLTEADEKAWPELRNVSVIPNPLSEFPQKLSSNNFHQMVAVGRNTYQKGFDLLVDAWNRIAPDHTDWKLKIIGSDVQALNARVKMKDSVILSEPSTHIFDEYLNSDFYVCSSRFEGFGMTIIEAMACGIPAISFDCPCGPRELIEDGTDGFLVQTENTAALASRMEWMIAHEKERKEMGVKASISAKRFEKTTIMQKWDRLFHQLLTD